MLGLIYLTSLGLRQVPLTTIFLVIAVILAPLIILAVLADKQYKKIYLLAIVLFLLALGSIYIIYNVLYFIIPVILFSGIR
ncbi:hypothetical protein DM558_03905 [Entomomonas moraniae]|uniref:Uncharacterized protein n=1 Tax=Entomomonas moraniae TaxID=2213226 RepID=A0A3S9XC92_9GAMM|nr:hypothetical protein DM558_03905 [Entomomonas moraniae]